MEPTKHLETAIRKLMSDELSTFFYELQRQLNPTIFTTDWVGHRLMHVDFAMIDGDLATVKTCFEERWI